MTVPFPNVTLTVTKPGGSPIDYTNNLTYAGGSSTVSINQNFGRQGDTAVFTLLDEYVTTPNIVIPVLSQIKFVDHNAGNQVLFAGLIADPKLTTVSPTLNEWELNCVDYTMYADAAVVHGVFYGFTVDQIVISLVKQANCGISAATPANGGFVQPGPQLASFVLNYSTLADAWRKLAVLAGSTTPFGWYVDENKAFHFYDATSAISSGVTFTTTPTTEGSTTEGHMQTQAQYEWDGTGIRNRIYVQGGYQSIFYRTPYYNHPPTDVWVGNGIQRAWPLKYTVIGTPIVIVGGVKQTISVVAAGSTGTTNWQVVQNSVGSWYLVTTTGDEPENGVKIQIWYNYQVPIVAQANDVQSQTQYNGPNHGIFSTFIHDQTLKTASMALNRAMRERTEYAFAVERITFTTSEDWIGWIRSGQTCTVVDQFVPDAQNSYTLGINDTFLVVGNSVQFADGGYRVSSITAIRV